MKLNSVTKKSSTASLCQKRFAASILLTIFLSGPAALAEMKFDEQMRAFREKRAVDAHRPGYHFVLLEGRALPFDPNGAIFWKGRYHMFYIFQDSRGHNWGHASSIDLVHWRHHPTGLVSGMFSGNCFINKDGVPTMCYHQTKQGGFKSGNAMAVALDDNLDTWKKLESNPITPKTVKGDEHHGKYSSWDPFGWLEGDTYYAIFGGKRAGIAKSKSLEGPWKYVGDLMAHTVGDVDIKEDISCADLFKIGDKYMLLCISHRLGARYYLGQWKNEQFYPDFHAQMSWVDREYFAPESLLDDKGRRIMWAWMFDESDDEKARAGTMGLPRVLSLGNDGMLRMSPPKELERLRYNPKKVKDLTVKADSEVLLKDIQGNSIEIMMEMLPKDAKQFGVKVCASPDGREETLIYYDANDMKIKVDTKKSSLIEGRKKIEGGPLKLKQGEPLKLRIYVDKSIVEVFANDRQAVARHIYPSQKDSVNVVVFSKGGSTKIRKIQAWDMMPSNPY